MNPIMWTCRDEDADYGRGVTELKTRGHMSEASTASDQSNGDNGRGILPIGTAGRVLVGIGFLYVALFDTPFGWGLQWHEALLGLLGFPAVTVLGVSLWNALAGTAAPIRATGHLGLCATTGVLIALVSVPFTQDVTVLFLGTTLLLAAMRGYAGCEVTAISNWFLRRDDQVGCMVFSPLDAAEAHFSRRSSENYAPGPDPSNKWSSV